MENQQKIQFIERSVESLKESLNKGMSFYKKFEDFIKNIKDWKEFEVLKKEAYAKRKQLDTEFENANIKLLKKTDLEFRKILKYISDKKLSKVNVFSKITEEESGIISVSFMEVENDLDGLLLSLKGRISGRINSSSSGAGVDRWNLVSSINKCLYHDFDKEHVEFIKKYVSIYKNNPEIVESYFNIQELKDYFAIKSKIEAEENTKFWYTVFYVCEIYAGMQIDFKYEEYSSLSQTTFMSAFEWDSIKKRNHTDVRRYFSYFDQNTMMLYVEGIANNIYAKLLISQEKQTPTINALKNKIIINKSLFVTETQIIHKTYSKTKGISNTKYQIIDLLVNSYNFNDKYKLKPETIAEKLNLNKETINNEVRIINSIVLGLYNLPKNGLLRLIIGTGKNGYLINKKVYKP